MDTLKKHLGFLVSSTKHVKDMKGKMYELNLAENDMRHKWDQAVERNHEVSHHVLLWLDKVKKINEEAESIPTGEIGCFNVAKRYKAGKQSCTILKEIQDLETRKSNIEFTDMQIPLAEINAILKGEISEVDDYVPNVTYPSSLLQTCHRLQHLELQNDERVEEVVFEMDILPQLLLPYLKVIELHGLKELSHVWKCNWNKFLNPYQNLTYVTLWGCHKITYLFSPLMAKFLSNLKYVIIGECDGIEEVVSWIDDEYEENTSTSSEEITTFFPCLETLKLYSLKLLNRVDGGDTRSRSDTISSNITDTIYNYDQSQSSQVIDAFWSLCQYPRNISIQYCHSLSRLVPWYDVRQMKRLEYMKVENCETMMEVLESESSTINVDEGSAHTILPSSSDPAITKGIPCSFHNLIQIELSYKDVETIIPSHALLQLQKLQKISIQSCRRVKELFEVAALEGSGFNESQTVVEIPNLTQVTLQFLNGLKYLWKSNQWMVLEFPNLTTLSIQGCHKLEYVFTCSMVGSLVQLQDLFIDQCKNLEVIVKEEEECDDKVNEIMLPRLKSLKLNDIQSLMGFCLGKEYFSLPSLDTLEIHGCSAVTVFTKGYLSTPELKVIDTRFGKYM
ncbi:hypothetical protein L1987_88045 [Smallanthus sonchifolius]|nr:hypothetical protein L1987_88045 [Smallanthus sonchifolius]